MKVLLLAFRGTGDIYTPDIPGLIRAGHVGLQFEDDDIIYGFHPTPEAVEDAGGELELFLQLIKRKRQPGRVQNDTVIFHEAAKRGGQTQVYALEYDLPDNARDQLIEWYNNKKVFWYNFPRRGGGFHPEEYNCSTFPTLIGLQVPEDSGRMRNFMEKMQEQGAKEWQP